MPDTAAFMNSDMWHRVLVGTLVPQVVVLVRRGDRTAGITPDANVQTALSPVLISHFQFEIDLRRTVVQSGNERGLSLHQKSAPQLARTRQFTFIRV